MSEKYSEIILLADQAAKEIEVEFRNRPIQELLVWLKIGLQREALVSKAYSPKYINNQVKEIGLPQKVNDHIVETICSAWAQETSHETYAKSILQCINPPKNLWESIDLKISNLKGKIEGVLIANLISSRKTEYIKAKIGIVIGKFFEEVPDFINNLRNKGFRDFCLMNMALEKTAIYGYKRMTELLCIIAANSEKNFKHTTLHRDLSNIYDDEKYHYELFRFFSEFPPNGGTPSDPNGGISTKTSNNDAPNGNPNDTSLTSTITNAISNIQSNVYGKNRSLIYRELSFSLNNIRNDEMVNFISLYLND